MFQTTVSIVTTTLVVLHALLGCCAHHTHACGVQVEVPASVAVQENDQGPHGCHCNHPAAGSTSSHQACDPQDSDRGHCDEPECSFVLDQRIPDLKLSELRGPWLIVASEIDGIATAHAVLGHGSQSWAAAGCLPGREPLRANLQVWRL